MLALGDLRAVYSDVAGGDDAEAHVCAMYPSHDDLIGRAGALVVENECVVGITIGAAGEYKYGGSS